MTQLHTPRKKTRLETYDYSSAGAYFVTICAQMRGFGWFGQVIPSGMQPNHAGKMVQGVWHGLAGQFGVSLDAFVVMPDHVHGIVVLHEGVVHDFERRNVVDGMGQGDDKHRPYANPISNSPIFAPRRGEPCVRPVAANNVLFAHANGTADGSLGRIIQAFKSITTNQYIGGVREHHWMPFEKRFWQRGFYDRIVRNNAELERNRDYIMGNPARWLENGGTD
jgi:putative transposase